MRSLAIVAVLSGLMGLAPIGGQLKAEEAYGDLQLLSLSTKSRIVSQVGGYSDARRWKIYSELNRSFLKLWDKGTSPVVVSVKTRTFPGFSYLNLEDRDRDGAADFYAYYPRANGGQTQEFGAFFDLAGDGSPDWLVFYGGSAMSEQRRIVWWNHHAIDRNNDGKFDTIVVDCVDKDGDGLIETGVTVWVYDVNFDGRFDAAEHIQNGRVTKIPVVGGRLDTKRWGSKGVVKVGERLGTVFDKIGKDIAVALRG